MVPLESHDVDVELESHRYVSNALRLRNELWVERLGLLNPKEAWIHVPDGPSESNSRCDARDRIAQRNLKDAA